VLYLVSTYLICQFDAKSRCFDVPPMMTAMALGIMIGNSTEPVIGVDYELLPCLIAILCMQAWLSLGCKFGNKNGSITGRT